MYLTAHTHVLPPSQNNCNYRVQNLSHKKLVTLTYLPQKTRQFLEDSSKRQLTPHPLLTKGKGYFGNFTSSIGLRIWSYNCIYFGMEGVQVGKIPVYYASSKLNLRLAF